MNYKFLLPALFGVLISCKEQKDPQEILPSLYQPPISVKLDTSKGYTINPFTGDSVKPIGNYFTDTIKTGVPLHIKGKVVSTDTIAKPETYTIRARNEPDFHTNVQVLSSNANRFIINESALQRFKPQTDTCNCPLVGTFGDTLPYATPVSLDLKLETWAVAMASEAMPPRMRDNARYNIKYLDMEHGMLSLSPLAIMQDDRGSMWISADDVCEYDGAYFRHFIENNGTRLTYVQSMMQDSRGDYWFCGAAGIFCSDGIKYFKLRAEDGLLYRNDTRTMVEDKEGNIWLGSKDGVVTKYQPPAENVPATLTHYKLRRNSPEGNVISSHLDHNGHLWFGTSTDGVFRFDGQSFIRYGVENGLSSNTVNSICSDMSGNIWIGTNAGLCQLNLKNQSATGEIIQYGKEEGLSHSNIKSIIEAKDGTIWLGTWGGGLNRLVIKKDGSEAILCEHYSTQDGLTHDVIRSLFEDQSGNIWIAPDGGGINILKPNSFQHITDPKGLIDLNVRTVFQDKNKNIWFGTEGPGIHRLQPAMKNEPPLLQHFEIPNNPSLGWTFSIIEDSNDDLWFGSREGVWKLDVPIKNNVASIMHYSWWEPFKSAWITSMVEDRNGNFWWATYSGGLVHYRPSRNGSQEVMIHYAEYFGFVCDYITSIAEDQNGNLWIATDQNGLCHFTPSGDGTEATVIMYTEREGLRSNHILSLHPDHNHNLWIASNWAGATYFEVPQPGKEGSFTSFTKEQGLSDNQIRSIYSIKNTSAGDQVWISSTNGLNLLTRLNEKDYYISSFGRTEGLKLPSFRVSCVNKDDQDQMWWGVENGLEKLDLKSISLSSSVPKVYLRQLDINGKAIAYYSFPDSLRTSIQFNQIDTLENLPVKPSLSYKNNHLTFHFSGIDWAAPYKIQYSYKIDDLNDHWSIPSHETKAEYRNLPSGTYTFQVRAIGQSQKWSEPSLYTFTIRPPWWSSWYAFTMYGLFGGLVLYRSHRFQVNRKLEVAERQRLVELDRIKNRLYTNITHEFRTPLTLIHGPVLQAISKNSSLDQKEIQSIYRQSERLQQLINQMLELQKLESGMLKPHFTYGEIIQTLRYLFASFETWAEEKKISLLFSSSLQEVYMDFDKEKLTQIITNLVSNAIKHTPRNGKIGMVIDVTRGGEYLSINVTDTGSGISEEDLPYIFDRFYQSKKAASGGTGIGLALVKNLTELLGGKITVDSKVDQGSTFSLMLPITRQAPIVIQPSADLPINFNELADDETQQQKTGKPLVLVVEDHPEVLKYIVSCLSQDYDTVTAVNGNEGLRMAEEQIPDLIISDVMMPGKDGFELCTIIKKDIKTSHIPIILLTGKGDHEAMLSGIEQGADAYVLKPFDPVELNLRVRKLLELRNTLSQHYLQHAVTGKVESVPSSSLKESQFLKNLKGFVQEHMNDSQFNMNMLCHHMAMSHPQLHRKVTALTGESTGKFVRSIRLTKAIELLINSDMTISEIAYETGFSDPGYFTRVFTKEYNISPSEYRAKST